MVFYWVLVVLVGFSFFGVLIDFDWVLPGFGLFMNYL